MNTDNSLVKVKEGVRGIGGGLRWEEGEREIPVIMSTLKNFY